MSRHIILSGGSRGLGRALVEGLLAADYRVSTFSRRGSEFTEQLATHAGFFFAEADVSVPAQTQQFVHEAVEAFGPPFGLINCAGVARDGVLATMPETEISQLVSINLAGALQLTRQAVRQMLLGPRGGVILNVSSIIGIRGYRGLAAYAATKAGMDGMTRALARELGSRCIRVNSVAPGYLSTDMTGDLAYEQRDQIVRRTPLGRLGTCQDVLGPVLFLLSDDAAFITGQTIVIDGGITC